MSIRAAIDLGTNTALLLVARVEDGKLRVICEEQRMPRLGKGVDRNGSIPDENIRRTLDALGDYQKILADGYPEVEKTILTGTSAVRDAANRDKLISAICRKTGWELRLLTGEEEAEWTFRGARSMLPDSYKKDMAVVLDIGGGSTEIALGRNGTLTDRYSHNMGCVRFTERFLSGDPPAAPEIAACRGAIRKQLAEHPFSIPPGTPAIGVAGTVTSLAHILLNLDWYDIRKINGYLLTIDRVREFIARFSAHPAEDLRKQWPQALEGRADIILAGLLILEEFMECHGFGEIVVSTGGIRHGAVLSEE